MDAYQSKFNRLPGTSYKEIYHQAFEHYTKIKKRTKRQPYVRSKYFGGQKVFLNLFWRHLDQKNWNDRARRLRFFIAAIDLIKNSNVCSVMAKNPNKPFETFYRFNGKTSDKITFVVQIKENVKTSRKFFLSVFP